MTDGPALHTSFMLMKIIYSLIYLYSLTAKMHQVAWEYLQAGTINFSTKCIYRHP